jgi:hypothetical protein
MVPPQRVAVFAIGVIGMGALRFAKNCSMVSGRIASML